MKNIKRITALYIFMVLLIIALANLGDDWWLTVHLKQIVYLIPYGDKWGHFILMGLLAFFVNLFFKCEKLKIFKLSFLKGSVIILTIVTLEELSQIFIDSRSFDLLDLTFDYLGILLFGQLALWYFRSSNAN